MRRLGSVVIAMLVLAAPASAAELDAHGSVRQVYATGIRPGTEITLADAGRQDGPQAEGDVAGRRPLPRVSSQAPATRCPPAPTASAPVTVLSAQSAPPDAEGLRPGDPGQRLRLPDHPRRDEALAVRTTAVERHERRPDQGPDAARLDAQADPDRVRRLRLRGPGRSAERHRDPRQPHGLHGRQRQHARHGLLAAAPSTSSSRCRASTATTSSRRSPASRGCANHQRRDDGHLLRRHQPALHGADAPAEPGRHLAAVACSTRRRRRCTRAASSTRASRSTGPRSASTTPCPPAEDAGQEWASKRIKEGDAICNGNQTLHANAVDLLRKVRENDHYVPKVADPLSPLTFVDKIDVPVFMACQWTDEQTGGHCPTLAAQHDRHRRASGSPSPTAPTSTRSAPETFNRWYDFLQLYVAGQAPIANAAVYPGRRAGRSTRRRWGSPA